MATHKSAIKRHRQSLGRKLNNQQRRTRVKNLTKDIINAVEAGDREAAESALREAVPAIQKAGSTSTLHRNTASRKISRLTRKVNSLPSDQ